MMFEILANHGVGALLLHMPSTEARIVALRMLGNKPEMRYRPSLDQVQRTDCYTTHGITVHYDQSDTVSCIWLDAHAPVMLAGKPVALLDQSGLLDDYKARCLPLLRLADCYISPAEHISYFLNRRRQVSRVCVYAS